MWGSGQVGQDVLNLAHGFSSGDVLPLRGHGCGSQRAFSHWQTGLQVQGVRSGEPGVAPARALHIAAEGDDPARVSGAPLDARHWAHFWGGAPHFERVAKKKTLNCAPERTRNTL